MHYFPFLRGRRNELLAVRELAAPIAEFGRILPIIEPVKHNGTTRITLEQLCQNSTPFLFICNPPHGYFHDNIIVLRQNYIGTILTEYGNWTPTFYLDMSTQEQELQDFITAYANDYSLALVYFGNPSNDIRHLIRSDCFRWHIFKDRGVDYRLVQSIRPPTRVMLYDPFDQRRNADYPPQAEFFTAQNTIAGNPNNSHFGDFSIVGDNYTEERRGPAYAVALHHIHFAEDSRALYISHFISDRRHTSLDPEGKTMEAISHLVAALGNLQPNNTQACLTYRQMLERGQSSGQGHMRRFAIKHHLEVMLGGGLEG